MLENLWLVEPGVVVICHNPKQLGRYICLFFLLLQFNFSKRYYFLSYIGLSKGDDG